MTEHNGKPGLPAEPKAPMEGPAGNGNADPKKELLEQVKKLVPIILGLSGNDPRAMKDRLLDQAKKLVKNPAQFSGDFWDTLFGTGADGISREDDAEKKGTIAFAMELPEPVRMPRAYSVAYRRFNEKKNEVVTMLERDGDGNIRYSDAGKACVFVRTEGGFRKYPAADGENEFGEWDGVLLSARSVRSLTEPFWKCADQTFIKWLGVEFTEKKEYLGRPCGLYHAKPGTITFTYHCDMIIDDETGICLYYTANKLLKGAVFSETEDNRVRIGIGDYAIGGNEQDFFCESFETENVSFSIPEV